jgi:hypothetical protein
MERVIFDTNAYRYLTRGIPFSDIDSYMIELKSRERSNEIKALFSPIVAKELLAHIADENDSAFDKCLRANQAMYLHCGNPQEYEMAPSFELQLSKLFWGKTMQKKEETHRAIGQLCYHFALNNSDETRRKLNNNLQNIKAMVDDGEQGFIDGMREFVKILDPSSTGWQIHPNNEKERGKALAILRSEDISIQIALGFVAMTYLFLLEEKQIKQEPKKDLIAKAKTLLGIFPEPIALHKYVIEQMFHSNFDMSQNNRSNFVWDISLMFNVGKKHQIDGSKLYFVTSDKAMINTAIGCNDNFSILTFNEYKTYLGL